MRRWSVVYAVELQTITTARQSLQQLAKTLLNIMSKDWYSQTYRWNSCRPTIKLHLKFLVYLTPATTCSLQRSVDDSLSKKAELSFTWSSQKQDPEQLCYPNWRFSLLAPTSDLQKLIHRRQQRRVPSTLATALFDLFLFFSLEVATCKGFV